MPTRASDPSETARARAFRLDGVFVFLLAVLSHAHVLQAPLRFDDFAFLEEARRARDAGQGPPFFLARTWALPNAVLYALSFAAAEDSVPYRVLHLAAHGAAAASLYALGRALARASGAAAGPAPLLASALFSLHPVHHGAVYGILTLHHELIALFWLLALQGYLASRRGGGRGAAVSLLSALAACATQESAVLLFPALALLAWALPRGAASASRYCLAGHLAVSLCLAAFLALSYADPQSRAGGDVRPGWHVLSNAAGYTSSFLWPDPLLAEVPGSLPRAALLGVAAGLVLRAAAGSRLVAWLLVWYLLALLPYCLYASGVASRLSYAAAAPFSLLAGLAAVSAWRAVVGRAAGLRVVAPRALRGAAIAALLLAAAFLYARLRSYDATYVRIWGSMDALLSRIVTEYRAQSVPPERIVLLDVPWDPANQTAAPALRLRLAREIPVLERRGGERPPEAARASSLVVSAAR